MILVHTLRVAIIFANLCTVMIPIRVATIIIFADMSMDPNVKIIAFINHS